MTKKKEVYRVVLDIDNLPIYDVGMKLKKREKKRCNEAEIYLEKVRENRNKFCLPRIGATYVCANLNNAHKWYVKIDAKQNKCYYVYKLAIEGHLQWHNSVYYEYFFKNYYKQKRRKMCKMFLQKLANDYWNSKINKKAQSAEGLFWGTAIVLERKHFNHVQQEIP